MVSCLPDEEMLVCAPEDKFLESFDRKRYTLAREWSQREAAYGLIYESYMRGGLGVMNRHAMRVTPHHLLDSTQIFVGESFGQVDSTVTVIADGEYGLPMEGAYPCEVSALRSRGVTLAEVSCLAERVECKQSFLSEFCQLTRLMAQFARRQGIDQLLAAVHPRHSRFYVRYLGFQQIGGLATCGHVRNRPAVALSLDFSRIDHDRPACYLDFFGERIPDHHLEPYYVCDDEKELLREIVGASFPRQEEFILAAG